MAKTTDTRIAKRIKDASEGTPGVPPGALTIENYLSDPRVQQELAEALPQEVSIERLHRLVVTAIRQTPKLQECTMASIYAAIINAAQIGLEPGPMQHVAIIPRWNGYRRQNEASLEIMYRGMLELSRRSGDILDAYAQIVYEEDQFDFTLGDNPTVMHKPSLLPPEQRGQVICAYFIAHFRSGGRHVEIMPYYELMDIRDRFGARNREGKLVGPWVTDEQEMMRKTVVRRASKYLPMSVADQRAIAQDQTVKLGIARDMQELPDMSEHAEALRRVNEEAAAAVTVEASTVETPTEEREPEEKPRKSKANAKKGHPVREPEPEEEAGDPDIDPATAVEWAAPKNKRAVVLKLRSTLHTRYAIEFTSLTDAETLAEMSEKELVEETASLSDMLNKLAIKGHR